MKKRDLTSGVFAAISTGSFLIHIAQSLLLFFNGCTFDLSLAILHEHNQSCPAQRQSSYANTCNLIITLSLSPHPAHVILRGPPFLKTSSCLVRRFRSTFIIGWLFRSALCPQIHAHYYAGILRIQRLVNHIVSWDAQSWFKTFRLFISRHLNHYHEPSWIEGAISKEPLISTNRYMSQTNRSKYSALCRPN